MSDYLMMIASDERAKPTAADVAALLDARASFARGLGADLIDAGRLRPSGEGKLVRGTGVEDGPFDHALASYYVVRADSLEAAVALDVPLAPSDVLEIRPITKQNIQPGKLDQVGKVFAFTVLGAAPDEPSWNQLMDRIAAETTDKFPPESFLGGLRLPGPTTGRKVSWDKRKRNVVDGPFLESKEVIGGLFFMRMASLDEAIAWARTTGFVRHGALEIRELWRS